MRRHGERNWANTMSIRPACGLPIGHIEERSRVACTSVERAPPGDGMRGPR
jgi:hypothetical protein